MLYDKAIDSPPDAVLPAQTEKVAADRKIEGQKSATILQRIAAADRSAAEECINKHGALIWALAKQFTDSTEEAEAATQGIFLDLWKFAEHFDSAVCKETDFIVLVARRWFIKRNLQSAPAPATNSKTSV